MKTLAIAALMVGVAAACSDGLPVSAAQQPQARTTSPSTSPSSAADLDRLLAPIALYPDQLIAQMLLCAADPRQISELNGWLAANKDLKGTSLQDAATVDGFEPSFVALALFPQVVAFMAERLDWTTQLGKTFAADKSGVFASIQRLRTQAQKSGALKDTPQQDVETRTTSTGQQVIVIEPSNPQVIYVPQYNPQVVYTQPATTTVVVQEDNDADEAAAALIGFTAGIAIGAAIDNDYYYGPMGWHGGVYMYNDGWDDWYDAREDAREDWIDHREDLVEERGDRAENAREQRTERTENAGEQRTERAETRQNTRTDTQAQRTERQQTQSTPQQTRQQPQATQQSSRGYSGSERATQERSGTRSDAFSGYSSGGSERTASARGQRSRSSSSRGGGGRRR
jgi:hypothetical protein